MFFFQPYTNALPSSASKIFEEKSAADQIIILLYAMHHFSLAALKIFLLIFDF